MTKKLIEFKRGDSATLDDLEIIFKYMPLGSRKGNQEGYFVKNCKVTIEYND